MSDPMPNCVIDVHFDEVEARFSYVCTESSRGWQVYPDGSIYPPDPERVVQFRIRSGPATLAGFQISTERPNAVPPSHSYPALPPGAGVIPISPMPYPPEDGETFTELTFRFDIHRFFYRLAVVVEGSEPVWDDPKIHDDGSQ